MAWVTVRQAMILTGKARSSLYRDMSKGRVSYRTEPDGGRSLDTSELIRAYGAIRHGETPARDTQRQGDETTFSVIQNLVLEMKSLREEVAGLRGEMQEMRRIEYKPGSDAVEKKWWQLWRVSSKGK